MGKNAVITILGLAGGKVEKNTDGELFVTNFQTKQWYYFDNKPVQEYTNTLPLLIDTYSSGYDIVPIYTKEAKLVQMQLMKENESKDVDELFLEQYLIEDENNYNNVLKLIDTAFNNEKYDKLIIDLTHGFRHLPILATVNLIMLNIQNIDKIEHIWFAKEEIKADNKSKGKYKIIDLIEYLDLANLSFILSNFKDNYTISKHISIKNSDYKELLDAMNRFSNDVMSLSIENLLDNSSKKLSRSIDALLTQDIILKHELIELQSHLNTVFTKKEHRYQTYFILAKDLSNFDDESNKERGYLVHTLALIFEGIGFYIKSRFSLYDDKIKDFIDKKEREISENKDFDYYKLIDACRSYLLFDKERNTNTFFGNYQNDIYSKIDEIEDIKEFKNYVKRAKKLRNNLLHANSGSTLNNTRMDIKKLLNDYQSLCIDKDILHPNNIATPPKTTNDLLNKFNDR